MLLSYRIIDNFMTLSHINYQLAGIIDLVVVSSRNAWGR